MSLTVHSLNIKPPFPLHFSNKKSPALHFEILPYFPPVHIRLQKWNTHAWSIADPFFVIPGNVPLISANDWRSRRDKSHSFPYTRDMLRLHAAFGGMHASCGRPKNAAAGRNRSQP